MFPAPNGDGGCGSLGGSRGDTTPARHCRHGGSANEWLCDGSAPAPTRPGAVNAGRRGRGRRTLTRCSSARNAATASESSPLAAAAAAAPPPLLRVRASLGDDPAAVLPWLAIRVGSSPAAPPVCAVAPFWPGESRKRETSSSSSSSME